MLKNTTEAAIEGWKNFLETEEQLDRIVEEISVNNEKKLSKKEQEKKDSRRRRINLPTDDELKDQVRPGRKEMRQLAIGLMEDEELEEEVGCAYNKKHGVDGKFSSKKERGSWSALSGDCDKTGQHRRARGMDKPGVSSAPCGRKNRKKLCRTRRGRRTEALVGDGVVATKPGEVMTSTQFEKVLRRIVRQEISRVLKSQSKKGDVCSLPRFVKTQDLLSRSEKGKLSGKNGVKS